MKTFKFLLLTAILSLHPASIADEERVKVYGAQNPCLIELDGALLNLTHIASVVPADAGFGDVSKCKVRPTGVSKSLLYGIKNPYENDDCDKIRWQYKRCVKSLSSFF